MSVKVQSDLQIIDVHCILSFPWFGETENVLYHLFLAKTKVPWKNQF